MRMVCLTCAMALAGCAHRGALPERVRGQVPPEVAVSSSPVVVPAAAPPRGEVLKEPGTKTAVSAAAGRKGSADDDDFIDVDDKKAFKKSWPMLLFIGLIGLAAGWI